jgi:hypothetical protein
MIPHHDHHLQILHPSLKAQWHSSHYESIHSHDIKTKVNIEVKFEHIDILVEHPQEWYCLKAITHQKKDPPIHLRLKRLGTNIWNLQHY